MFEQLRIDTDKMIQHMIKNNKKKEIINNVKKNDDEEDDAKIEE